MKAILRNVLVLFLLTVPFGRALAADYADTIRLFRDAEESREYFNKSYGYAVFPFIGKGGYILGVAYGQGQVYRGGTHVGDVSTGQITVGLLLGGQAYTQIIFFEDKRAFDDFTNGNLEFGVQATAVAITAGAAAQASSIGASASASGTPHYAKNASSYYKGMAVFTVTKGGLMYEASVGPQWFSYTQKGEQVARREGASALTE